MVEHFEMRFGHITSLYLINLVINMVAGPLVGRAVGRYGARNAHLLEYLGLLVVFFAYGGIFLAWGLFSAAVLYVLDRMFCYLGLAITTNF